MKPSHHSLLITVKFLKIDSWDYDDWVDVYIGGVKKERITSSVGDGVNHQCGTVSGGFMGSQPENEKMFSLSYIISPYTSSNVEIKIISNFDESISNESWGIREIYIILKMCDTSCLTCSGASSSDCSTCHTNAQLSNGVCSCRDYYYLKDAAMPCSSDPCATCMRCEISCKTCDGPNKTNCLSCESLDSFSNSAKTCTYPSSNK